jgi:hypothetical protein
LKYVEIAGARLMPHVWQGLLNLPEHSRSHAVISVVRVARSLVFCVVFLLSFFLAIVLSVVLQFRASDYPVGIFKLFWQELSTIPEHMI